MKSPTLSASIKLARLSSGVNIEAEVTGLNVKRRSFLIALSGLGLSLVACQPSDPTDHQSSQAQQASGLLPYAIPAANGRAPAFPSFVSAAVKESYLFAYESPAVLQALPCYCGCGLTVSHHSNLDCFIKGQTDEGQVVFDDHGSYCQTCVDIAGDAKRFLAEGKPLPVIRSLIDTRHGQKGPGTDTPKPAANLSPVTSRG